MGRLYKERKRVRKFDHVWALVKACERLGVELAEHPWMTLTVEHAIGSGCKRLGSMREHIIETAQGQGVDSELLYSTARQFAPIPRFSVQEHIVTRSPREPQPAQPVAQIPSTRSARRTSGPCVRCTAPLWYGRLSGVHRSLGDHLLDVLGNLFQGTRIEEIQIDFPWSSSWFEKTGNCDWRSLLRRRRVQIRLRPRPTRSYRWETVRPYFCPDCLKAFENQMDTRWAAWVEQCKREDAEASAQYEIEREQERLQAERIQRQRERRVTNAKLKAIAQSENRSVSEVAADAIRLYLSTVTALI
jgi:hypothetical protein